MSEHVGESWRGGWVGWLRENLPAELDGFEVIEANEKPEGGSRPARCVVVGFRQVERVPSMDSTGRVFGVIALREPFDDSTLEEHKARASALWNLLQTVEVKPGPLVGVFLHDLRVEDRESGVLEDDRVSGWPVSSMSTATNEETGLLLVGGKELTVGGSTLGVEPEDLP